MTTSRVKTIKLVTVYMYNSRGFFCFYTGEQGITMMDGSIPAEAFFPERTSESFPVSSYCQYVSFLPEIMTSNFCHPNPASRRGCWRFWGRSKHRSSHILSLLICYYFTILEEEWLTADPDIWPFITNSFFCLEVFLNQGHAVFSCGQQCVSNWEVLSFHYLLNFDP